MKRQFIGSATMENRENSRVDEDMDPGTVYVPSVDSCTSPERLGEGELSIKRDNSVSSPTPSEGRNPSPMPGSPDSQHANQGSMQPLPPQCKPPVVPPRPLLTSFSVADILDPIKFHRTPATNAPPCIAPHWTIPRHVQLTHSEDEMTDDQQDNLSSK